MLKPAMHAYRSSTFAQPPSGGCVLKLSGVLITAEVVLPAAFRRLCVETEIIDVDVKDVIYASRLQAAVC